MARSNDPVVSFSPHLPSSVCRGTRKGYPLKVEWALAVLRGHPVTAVTEERNGETVGTRRYTGTAGRTGLGPMTSRDRPTSQFVHTALPLDVTVERGTSSEERTSRKNERARSLTSRAPLFFFAVSRFAPLANNRGPLRYLTHAARSRNNPAPRSRRKTVCRWDYRTVEGPIQRAPLSFFFFFSFHVPRESDS